MAATIPGGYRIPHDLQPVLERLAAARGWSISRYAGWALTLHLRRKARLGQAVAPVLAELAQEVRHDE